MKKVEARKVYDVVTSRELAAEEICELLLKHVKAKNWNHVKHYLDLFVRSVALALPP